MELQEIAAEVDFYRQKLSLAESRLLSKIKEASPKIHKVLDQVVTDDYAIYNGDVVEVIKGIPDGSIHYSIFSPPFSSLYVYSASLRDMGNSSDNQFYEHFDYLVGEMFRVHMPGRLLSFHCSDIPAMKERDGYIGLKDFPGMLLRIFEHHGWIYHSKVQIKKNELAEATRTKAIGLMHKQVVKDSAISRQALPDYIVTVRKPGENPKPISHGRGFEEYIGNQPEPTGKKSDDPAENKYSQKVFQRYASSIWLDIAQGDTLNVRLAREQDDERHLCPLQLQAISRCLHYWSLPGETVASWFGGIGSEPYQALLMGRKAIAVELKTSYFKVMARYLKSCAKSSKAGFKV